MSRFSFPNVLKAAAALVRRFSASADGSNQYQQLRELSDQLLEVSDAIAWRPMDSAPRDGTPIQVCGRWVSVWAPPETRQAVTSLSDESNFVSAIDGEALHWHPLLPVPAGLMGIPGTRRSFPSAPAAHPILDRLRHAARTLESTGAFLQAARVRECADQCADLLNEASRYEYLLDCEFVSARQYLPDLVEDSFKAQRRTAHDQAIAGGGARAQLAAPSRRSPTAPSA